VPENQSKLTLNLSEAADFIGIKPSQLYEHTRAPIRFLSSAWAHVVLRSENPALKPGLQSLRRKTGGA
jgi:hypothetical protein